MIFEKDIKRRISDMLTDAGFNVVASEVDEGFKKPAVFVNVYPTIITAEFTAMEQVTDTVEIMYIPAVETTEECAETAQKIRSLFMHKPFDVEDRRLTVQEMEFDIEEYILYVYFELSYYQAVEYDADNEEEYDTMQNLEIGGNI